jgi:hypothetical protein
VGWLKRLFGLEPEVAVEIRIEQVESASSDFRRPKRWHQHIPRVAIQEQQPPAGALALQHPFRGAWLEAIDESQFDEALLKVRGQLSARKVAWPDQYQSNTIWVTLAREDQRIVVRSPEGMMLAHFPKRETTRYLPVFELLEARFPAVWCRATIHGGYDRGVPFAVRVAVPAPTDYRAVIKAAKDAAQAETNS